MGKKNKNKYENNLIYMQIYEKYKNLALDVYEWENLPDYLDSRIVEEMLFENGLIAFLDYNEMGLICLPCTPGAERNIMGQPINYIAKGFNENINITTSNAVIVRNNNLATPTEQIIRRYAARLFAIERTIEVNVNGQKTPNIIVCDDKTKLTMDNVMQQVEDYSMAIITDKQFSINENISVLNCIAPYVADKLTDLKHDTENELLTILGYNNANTDKKERLVTSEVNSNNQLIKACGNIGLYQREIARDLINKMFNVTIDVKLKNGGEEEDGTLYTGTEGSSGTM